MSSIEDRGVLIDGQRTFPPSAEFSRKAHIGSIEEYNKLYKKSIDDPEGFWAEIAEKELTWFNRWDKGLEKNLVDVLEEGLHFIFKPVSINDLLRKVREVLDK
jgi:hypothetical protein